MQCSADIPINLVQKLSKKEFTELLAEFKDYSLCHGNLMKIHTDPLREAFKAHTSSTTIVPSPFPEAQYEHSLRLQPLFNKLYHRVSCDTQFLEDCILGVAVEDEFMRKHLEILRIVQAENYTTKHGLCLGLTRSDYMLHQTDECIKQVEMNLMSAAASGVNRAATKWHRYVTDILLNSSEDHKSHIPENSATLLLAQAIVKVNKLYAGTVNKRPIILFLVGENEFNFADQRWLQYAIHDLDPSVKVVRATFQQLVDNLTLDSSRRLLFDGDEVGVVYFRYGYAPIQYTSEQFWDVRLMIECSLAVKCPSIRHALAGTKRIQQIVCDPEVLSRFLPKANESSQVLETFVELHSLNEDEGGERAVELALSQPHKYILKPQREGGGNNFYGDEMVEKLKSLTGKQRNAYTLMEKIVPPKHENYLISGQNDPELIEVISELGVFGALIMKDDEEIMNEGAGFLLRSKSTVKCEGDLKRGTSSLDSPWLI